MQEPIGKWRKLAAVEYEEVDSVVLEPLECIPQNLVVPDVLAHGNCFHVTGDFAGDLDALARVYIFPTGTRRGLAAAPGNSIGSRRVLL